MMQEQEFTLSRLVIKNFLCFKDVDLDFADKDIVGILARYRENKSRSNRAGKSSIGDAVDFLLSGLHRGSVLSELVHIGEQAGYIEGVFTDGKKDFTVKRGFDVKSTSSLEVDWITKQEEAQDAINKLFGISPKDLRLTNFLKQGDEQGFMKLKPAQQAEFMSQYMENTHWKEKYKKATEARNVLQQQLKDNNNLKKSLEGSVQVDETLHDLIAELEEKNINIKGVKTDLVDKLAVAREKVRTYAKDKKEREAELSAIQSQIDELHEELSEIEENESAFKTKSAELADVQASLKKLKNLPSETEISKKQTEAEISINDNKALIEAHNKNKGVCPIIKKSCSLISFSEKDIEKKRQKIRELADVISDCAAVSIKLEKRQRLLTKEAALKTAIQKLNFSEELKDKKNSELKKLEEKLEKLAVNKKNNKTQLNDQISDLETRISNLDEQIEKHDNKIVDYKIKISEAEKAREKIEKIDAENLVLQKKITRLNYVCFMFSPKGIPAQEIENAFGEIEDYLNQSLKKIGTGFTVSFSPDKEIKKKEPVCICGHNFVKGFRGAECPVCKTPRQWQKSEEINFKVNENGQQKGFHLDSGGGKQIISYAVKIAFTRYKRAIGKCRLNMLFLDEIDSALDSYLTENVIDSITKLLVQEMGFKQVIIVSHKEQIKSSVPHIIQVTRHDTKGYSTARFV